MRGPDWRTSSTLLTLGIALSACGDDVVSTDEVGGSTTQTSSASESESAGESGSSTSESGTETSEPDPFDCWQPLVTAHDVWGTSTQGLLLATPDGVVRVEGETFTTVGSGLVTDVWGSDLQEGWALREGQLVRIVDDVLEPWPDAIDFDPEVIDGRGPNEVWVGGSPVDASGVLARFDGSTWTSVFLGPTFGATLDEIHHILVTQDFVYFGGPSSVRLLAWDGASGSVTPDFTASPTSLITRDGVRPLSFTVWCDFGCTWQAYELVEGSWQWFGLPNFEGWSPVLLSMAGRGSGMWSVASDEFDPGVRRIVHELDGAWFDADARGGDGVAALPDGVVTYGNESFRATRACLFGR